MKLDQLAFYCVGNDAALHVKKTLGLQDAQWSHDTVTSEVTVWRERMEPWQGVNVAELQFNESWGMQLEIIRYVDGLHWCMSTSTTMTGLRIWLTKSWCSRRSPNTTLLSQTGLISTGYTRWLRAHTSSIFRGSRNDCR